MHSMLNMDPIKYIIDYTTTNHLTLQKLLQNSLTPPPLNLLPPPSLKFVIPPYNFLC